MLNATIGLSEWIGIRDTPAVNGIAAGASSAEANAGLAQSAIATPHVIIFLDTPASIVTLHVMSKALNESAHHVKTRHEISTSFGRDCFWFG